MKHYGLKPLLCAAAVLLFAGTAQAQGQTPPAGKKYRAYLVSNAHFDTQWRWDVQRSIDEFLLNTLDQNFRLLEDYPDYLINFEGAVKYAWAKEYYPERYERLKKYVAEGRWHLTGSTWDATDPNVPSAESFFRNVLLGQEFFKSEFGRKATDIFLPDCFGFGYTLPTIAAHCGLIGFSTQKLSWRTRPFYGDRKYPFQIGLWRGVDGAQVMAALDGGGYGWNPTGDLTRSEELIRRAEESGIGTAYRYYGTRSTEKRGDRGGSPLPRTVRNLFRYLGSDGPVELVVARADQLYKDYLPFSEHPELPVYDGELLMDVHGTGCYTAHSELKRFNRRSEQLADAAERSSVMADHLGVLDYPKQALNEEWRRFIWHQFHDDLTGTSIPRAYEFTWNDYLIAQSRFADIAQTATGAVASLLDTRTKGEPVVVYNPSAYRSRTLAEAEVAAPAGWEGVSVYGPDGRRVPAQVLSVREGRMRLLFAADVPSVGYAVYDVRPVRRAVPGGVLKASGRTVENRIYRVSLDERGDIVSVVDKRHGRELVGKGGFFGLVAFPENKSDRWPAWEILKEVVDRQPERVGERAEITVEECGPLRATLRVVRRYGDSELVQHISLTDGAADDRIDVRTEADWRSPRTLLKAQFPMSFESPKARYDLGIGTVERGNNTPTQYEVYAQHWAGMSAPDGRYGVAVLNDCKYGWDKPSDDNLRLTLLHTPTADGDYFPFQSALDIGHHRFTYSIVGHAGDYAAGEIVRKGEQLNQRLLTFSAPRHAGVLGRSYGFVGSSDEGVAVKAVKKAEDGDGYIVRVYETAGAARQARLKFPAEIVSAEEVNGIEEPVGPADFAGRELRVSVGRYAPKTYRVRLAAPAVRAPEYRQKQVTLPFNAAVISSDAFCALANMDSLWNSYSGELLTRRVEADGIGFRIGEPDFGNAVRCSGQTIALPAGGYDKLYLLVASSEGDRDAVVEVDGVKHAIRVPYYSGYYGQWGWADYGTSYLREGRLAHVGTHRHNPADRNEAYVFTYLYKVCLEIPRGARELRLPDDRQVVLFAATLSDDPCSEVHYLTEPRELP